jgi:hypothetical protein
VVALATTYPADQLTGPELTLSTLQGITPDALCQQLARTISRSGCRS